MSVVRHVIELSRIPSARLLYDAVQIQTDIDTVLVATSYADLFALLYIFSLKAPDDLAARKRKLSLSAYPVLIIISPSIPPRRLPPRLTDLALPAFHPGCQLSLPLPCSDLQEHSAHSLQHFPTIISAEKDEQSQIDDLRFRGHAAHRGRFRRKFPPC